MQIIFFGFIIKIILVLIQLYFVLPGTEFDADSFHNEAIVFSEYLKNNLLSEYNFRRGWIYSVFIGFFYSFFGASKVLGGILSALTWLLSAYIFRKILLTLKIDDYKLNLSLLSYIILFPISFYYTSLMLREVYLLLFVNLFFLSIVNISLKKKFLTKIFNFILFSLSIILLVSFHKAYIVAFILILLFILIFLFFKYLPKKYLIKISFIYWIVFLIVLVVFIINSEILKYGFHTIVNYQIGHFWSNTIFRADYLSLQDRTNLVYSFYELTSVIIENIFNYLLQPLPNNITTFKDQILFLENLIRFSLIIYVILSLFGKFQMKSIYFLGLVILLLMEIVYSSGTVNWGSASRHHIPINGLLLLLVFFPKKKR
jgi:hypothetical protein